MPTVLVTGAGGGIGRAICDKFSHNGYHVYATDINENALAVTKSVCQQDSCTTCIMDVCSADSIQSGLAKLGVDSLDVLVNNAATSLGTGILEMDEQTWDANVALALKSVYLVSRQIVPLMLKSGKGSIVNIGSVSGMSGLGEEAYSAAKAGVISLTENLAVRYGPNQIRVNCVAPGTISSPAWDRRVADNPNTLTNLAKFYPLGRIGQPADVANAVYFLGSEQAAWITGSTLKVDGGLLAGNAMLQSALMGKEP